MTAHIMQHSEHRAWPMMMPGWGQSSCGGSTWSKRGAASGADSWEVRAFMEDASSSGQWPPRSYSCSFCQREFRTAQALGGHMNVHRRERAHANQLASLRTAAAHLSMMTTTTTTPTVELLSPCAQTSVSMSGSAGATPLPCSPPSQESISSCTEINMMQSVDAQFGTKPLLQTIPDNVSETLSLAPSRGAASYHPYEKSAPSRLHGSRFSLCLNKVMGEREDTLDLELRLGRGSCGF